MSSVLRSVAQVPRTAHLAHGVDGFKLSRVQSVAEAEGATIAGSMMMFPTAAALNTALQNLQNGQVYYIDGDRAHLNGGKKLYWGIQGNVGNIITFTLILVTAGSNLGHSLYTLSEVNMNEQLDWNSTINDTADDVEVGIGA